MTGQKVRRSGFSSFSSSPASSALSGFSDEVDLAADNKRSTTHLICVVHSALKDVPSWFSLSPSSVDCCNWVEGGNLIRRVLVVFPNTLVPGEMNSGLMMSNSEYARLMSYGVVESLAFASWVRTARRRCHQ